MASKGNKSGKHGKSHNHSGSHGGRKQYGRRTSNGKRRRSVASLPVGTISIAGDGYGFVETSEGKFFVPAHRTNGAMDGDTVRLSPRSSNWRYEMARSEREQLHGNSRAPIASVERVLEHANSTMVGMFVEFDGFGYIIPQDKRMDYLVRADAAPGVAVSEGDIVLMRIEEYPSRNSGPSGVIERVIGRDGDSQIMEEIVAARHGLETQFSSGALEEAGAAVLDVEAALKEPDRRDIRDRYIFTIDPADARDFDDALSLDYVDGTMRMGVHIADVSSYVTWGSSVDLDARRRATSTYFPDRVIPMLPESLSNGLCSLNPNEDRLAFTVDIYLDKNVNVIKTKMYPSVIRSRLRLDYDSVSDMLDGNLPFPSDEAAESLKTLHKVTRKLFAKRIARGALDFASRELKVTFDDEGNPNGIIERSRNDATDLVEEAMILANEAVAGFMLKCDAPMVYRIHDKPNPSSMEAIVPVLKEFGYAKKGAPITNAQIQEILSDVKGKPEQDLVNMMLLRAMKQAVYRDHFTTHFGLASEGYTHFTSPIRRYPDLMAHRLLRLQLYRAAKSRGEYASSPKPGAIKNLDSMVDQLSLLCDHSSAMEREAEKAAYEALEIKISEYMEQFVGQRFPATIVNVTAFGFFVRIGNGCEGLVPVRSLSGWYEFDEEKRTLTKADSPKHETFSLGQNVQAVLESADSRQGRLTFSLDEA